MFHYIVLTLIAMFLIVFATALVLAKDLIVFEYQLYRGHQVQGEVLKELFGEDEKETFEEGMKNVPGMNATPLFGLN